MRKGFKWLIVLLVAAILGYVIVPIVMGWFVMM